MGPLIPSFWTFGDACSGFLSQGGFPHLHTSSPACNGFFRFTVGVTHTDLLMVSICSWIFLIYVYFFVCKHWRDSNPGWSLRYIVHSKSLSDSSSANIICVILWILLRVSVLWLPNYWVTKYHFHLIFRHGAQQTPCMYYKQACMPTANRHGQTKRQKQKDQNRGRQRKYFLFLNMDYLTPNKNN